VACPSRWINPTVGTAPPVTLRSGLQPEKSQARWAGLDLREEKEKKTLACWKKNSRQEKGKEKEKEGEKIN